MIPEHRNDLLASLVHAYMASKIREAIKQEVEERLGDETNQVMKEIEHFNLMNAIDRALDNRDKEAFMQLTGELHA